MVVTVHLHTILQIETPEGLQDRFELDLPPESTLADVLDELQIDFPVEGLLLVLNGRMATLESALSGGDVVHLMPAISGGVLDTTSGT